MSELYREIEEDMRRERADRLWNSFGKLAVGASVIVIFATVVIVMWQNHKQTVAGEQTARFIKGIDRLAVEDYQGAAAAFGALADDEHSPYYGLAMLRRAQAQNAAGDKEAAGKTYTALAAHDAVFGELARMQASSSSDALIAPEKSSPFYYAQSEWKGWQLLQQNKKADAVTQFIALRDDAETPYSMRERMQEVLQHIAPDKAAAAKVVSHE